MMQTAINFDVLPPYPRGAGWKGTDTSHQAAKEIQPSIKAAHIKILDLLAITPTGLTADQASMRLGWNVLYGRPRVAELKRNGKVRQLTERRPNVSGKMAAVWGLA